jgi:hypothetical protein
LALLLVFVAPVEAAFAQTVDLTTLTACVNVTNGTARLVATATVCQPNETLVTWSVHGPAGPQGPTGPTGPMGRRTAGTTGTGG